MAEDVIADAPSRWRLEAEKVQCFVGPRDRHAQRTESTPRGGHRRRLAMDPSHRSSGFSSARSTHGMRVLIAARTRYDPASGRAMVPQDITRIVWVSDPQISPDGARVAFVATTCPRSATSTSRTSGGGRGRGVARRFTAGPKRDRDPRWSPTGRGWHRVGARGEEEGQLYVCLPTAVSRRGCPTSAMASDPVWDPDGSGLAFVARVGGYHAPERERTSRSPGRRGSSHAQVPITARDSPTSPTTRLRRGGRGGPVRQITTASGMTRTRWSPTGRHRLQLGRHPDRDATTVTSGWWTPTGESLRSPTPWVPRCSPLFPRTARHRVLGRRSKNEFGRTSVSSPWRRRRRLAASRSGSTAHARPRGAADLVRTGGRSPSPPRTKARSGSIASGGDGPPGAVGRR